MRLTLTGNFNSYCLTKSNNNYGKVELWFIHTFNKHEAIICTMPNAIKDTNDVQSLLSTSLKHRKTIRYRHYNRKVKDQVWKSMLILKENLQKTAFVLSILGWVGFQMELE